MGVDPKKVYKVKVKAVNKYLFTGEGDGSHMATKQELFDALLDTHIDMGGYLNQEKFPDAGGVLDDHFKVLVYMLGLERELADFIGKPIEGVKRSMRRAYEKRRAEEAAFEKRRRKLPITKN